jgi:hypothetical protein
MLLTTDYRSEVSNRICKKPRNDDMCNTPHVVAPRLLNWPILCHGLELTEDAKAFDKKLFYRRGLNLSTSAIHQQKFAIPFDSQVLVLSFKEGQQVFVKRFTNFQVKIPFSTYIFENTG